MSVTIGALRESAPRETRVCLVPEVADKLTREGARVLIERGAGVRACFPDSLYKGVSWADSAAGVLATADVILTVQPLTLEQIGQLKPGAVVIGFMQPHARAAEVRALKARGVTSFAVELVPRISRAQSMDALSSHAAIAGYKTARIAAADAVITTASVPGRPAPKIISRAAVERMRAGSVVVDIAAEQGGNCELTRPGEVLEHQGVKIVGPVNLPAELAYNASEMYARNLYNFLEPALVKGELAIDWSDEVFAQSCLTSGGQIK